VDAVVIKAVLVQSFLNSSCGRHFSYDIFYGQYKAALLHALGGNNNKTSALALKLKLTLANATTEGFQLLPLGGRGKAPEVPAVSQTEAKQNN